jgi:hypothetical protein
MTIGSAGVIEVDNAFFRQSFKENLITELICTGLNGEK